MVVVPVRKLIIFIFISWLKNDALGLKNGLKFANITRLITRTRDLGYSAATS